MALAFHTLTFPLNQQPVRGSVRVRPVQDVVLDGEQREVVKGPSSATLIDGVYVLELDVLPDGYYHLITHPDGETITVVVPPGEPPHDSAHEVPGLTPVQYGWWVESIRADNPAVPPAVTVGVVSVTAADASIDVDNSDPRNPKLSVPGGGSGTVTSVDGVAPVAGNVQLNVAGQVATEAANRTAADTTLASLITGEAATARAAESANATAIVTEASTRGNADTANATAIANEITRATGVEAVKADLVAGKVPTSQLPALAVNEVFPVASQAAMLALTAQRGDIARRTDFTPNHLFLLTTDSPTTLGDWLLIVSDPGAGVDTVNGQSGTVVLGAADVGADAAGAAATAQAAAIAAASTDATSKVAAEATDRTSAIATQHTADVAAFQPIDPDLTTIAALDSTTAGALVTDGTGWFRKTYAQLKTALGLVKGDVGLGSVDNTSDANKPVSTAQAAADATVLSSAQTYADGKVIDSIADADTSHAPSRNAVFDALALKASALTKQAKTANYTAVLGDMVLCDTTGGTFTVTLPAASGGKGTVVVKWTAGTVAPIIAVTGSDHIDTAAGSTGGSFTLLNQAARYESDGTALWIIGASNFALSTLDTRYTLAGAGGVSGRWGDGSDGTVTISVNTSLARDMYYDNLTINAGVTLNTNGWRVYVRNTLTIAATGLLGAPGNTSSNSSWGGGPAGSSNALKGGTNGGDASITGAASAGGSGNNALVSSPGGAGGAGSSGAGGAGGTGAAMSASAITPKSPMSAFDMIFLNFAGYIPPGGGGGGGGGGGDGTNRGGGGGGAAGIALVNARILVNNGTITAKGGNGFPGAAGNAGGGGGGGGGTVFVNTTSSTGSGTVTAAGGGGGAGVGTGATGTAGTAGTTQLIVWTV